MRLRDSVIGVVIFQFQIVSSDTMSLIKTSNKMNFRDIKFETSTYNKLCDNPYPVL